MYPYSVGFFANKFHGMSVSHKVSNLSYLPCNLFDFLG